MQSLVGADAEEAAGGSIFGAVFLDVFRGAAGPSAEFQAVLVLRHILRADLPVLGDDCLLRLEFHFPSTTDITGILYNRGN